MNKKTKKFWIGFSIGAGLTVLLLVAAVVVLIYLFLYGPPAKTTRSVEKYNTIFTQKGVHTGYLVFPEEVPESAQEITFYNYYRDTWNAPTVQTYLQCTYDDNIYEQELDRLENTSKTYGKDRKVLLRDEQGKYNYPAYIAVENAAHCYEYALLTGENQITYIYTSYFDREDVEFSQDYLPSDFMTSEGREFGSGYSIYYSSVDDFGITADYTRNPVPEVKDAHLRLINDDCFYVYVKLDEQGREMITGCAFVKYNDKYEVEKEINYDDINGMQYVDMELNKDRTAMTVTYMNGAEEKQITYDLKE